MAFVSLVILYTLNMLHPKHRLGRSLKHNIGFYKQQTKISLPIIGHGPISLLLHRRAMRDDALED